MIDSSAYAGSMEKERHAGMNFKNVLHALFVRNCGAWFLCAVLLLYHVGFVWGLEACYVFGYLHGNSFLAYGIDAYFLIFLGCMVALTVFALAKLFHGLMRLFQRQLRVAAGNMVGCILACLVMWHMTLVSPYRSSEIVRGLTDSFLYHADLPALRAWANQVHHDPETATIQPGCGVYIGGSRWPDSVHALSPKSVRLFAIDETRHVLILQYGGAIIGHYGVGIVSSQDRGDSTYRSLEWEWGTIHITPEMATEGVFAWSEPTPRQESRRRTCSEQDFHSRQAASGTTPEQAPPPR